MSERLTDTARHADWGWLSDKALDVVARSSEVFSRVYGVNPDDLLQESLLWIAVRPNRRRDDIALRGAVKRVAQRMQREIASRPALPGAELENIV